MWTKNYVGWFLAFGYAVPFRPVEDLAFAVARFFETGGTFQNYYMYFGGTNFGRTAGGPLVATSYDYDAPINEYGSVVKNQRVINATPAVLVESVLSKDVMRCLKNLTRLQGGDSQRDYIFQPFTVLGLFSAVLCRYDICGSSLNRRCVKDEHKRGNCII